MPPLGEHKLSTPTTITCVYPVSPSSFSTAPCDTSFHKQPYPHTYFSTPSSSSLNGGADIVFFDNTNTPMSGVYSRRGVIVRTTSPLDDVNGDCITDHSFQKDILLQQRHQYCSHSEASTKQQPTNAVPNRDRNNVGSRRATTTTSSSTTTTTRPQSHNEQPHISWDWVEAFTVCLCLPEDACRSQNIPMNNFEDDQNDIRVKPSNSSRSDSQNEQSPRSVACKRMNPVTNQSTKQPVATTTASSQRRRHRHIVYPIAKYPGALNNPSLVEKRRESLRPYWTFQPVAIA